MISKLNLLHHYSSHDPSEIILKFWFAVQETFYYYYYYQYLNHLSKFFHGSLINRKIQRSVFIWNKKLFFILHYSIQKLGVSIIFFFFFFFWGGGGGIYIMLYKIILLFTKEALNWSKVMIKTFIMLQKISISDKSCSSELFNNQWNLKKIYSDVFNKIIIILEWFLKDRVNGVTMLKNQLSNHRNKLHFKIYSNTNHLYLNFVFWGSNKCRLDEQKRRL